MSTGTTILKRCAACGAENRVDATRAAQAVCGRCKTPLRTQGPKDASQPPHRQAEGPIDISQMSFRQAVLESPMPVVVDFWAPWCGPCRQMAPTFEAVARKLAGRIKFARINTDENQALSGQLGIRSIPTLILFRDGREVKRTAGAQSAAALEAFLTQ